MSNEIIQGVNYNNYDDFQHFNFIFPPNFISLFWGLFNDKIDLRPHKVLQELPIGQCITLVALYASPSVNLALRKKVKYSAL
jgi:hypothetical protein